MLVMIVHEFFKSLVYCVYVKKYEPTIETKGLFRIWRYIDPIGVIFSFCNLGVYSKQYPYIIKSRKAAVTIGLTGYMSMFVTFIVAIIKCRSYGLKPDELLCNVGIYGIANQLKHNGVSNLEDMGLMNWSMQYFWCFVAFFSVLMLIINLFPIVSFDITLILGVFARNLYYGVKKNDLFIKGLFIVLSVLSVFVNVVKVIIAIMLI